MYTLYLMRHGQTLYNLQRLVQGRCDSPLTSTGIQQAKAAGAWLASRNIGFSAIHCSPLKRAMDTAYTVRDCLHRDGRHPVPLIQTCPGLIERSYGSLEEGSVDDVPLSVWDPREEIVPFGGEGSVELRARMVKTLTQVMRDAVREAHERGEQDERGEHGERDERGEDGCNVLAVSHGSATMQFKLAWEHLAQCDQDQPLGNCCILAFAFDPADETFSNISIVNQ